MKVYVVTTSSDTILKIFLKVEDAETYMDNLYANLEHDLQFLNYTQFYVEEHEVA